MKQLLVLTIFLLFVSISGFSQTKIGVSTSVFQSTLSGVRTDLPYGYGFSGSEFTVHQTYGGSIGAIIQTSLFKFLELEYGLGYFYESERIDINYVNRWTLQSSIKKLAIDLHYLEVPLTAKLRLFKALNNEVILVGGLNTRFSIIQNSNYQDIIFEQIGFRKRQFNNFVWNGKVAIGISNNSFDKYEILLFISEDFSPFVRENPFGFMNALLPARNNQIGIQINYFFKTIKSK
jgi:hypothetical protein